MRKLTTALVAMTVIAAAIVSLTPHAVYASYVRGYTRSNGTYVQPYYRSNPNALRYDNYGYNGGSLYNPSYTSTRNYSSSWYTPSYLTQPDYFTGLNSYRSNHYNSSYSWLNW